MVAINCALPSCRTSPIIRRAPDRRCRFVRLPVGHRPAPVYGRIGQRGGATATRCCSPPDNCSACDPGRSPARDAQEYFRSDFGAFWSHTGNSAARHNTFFQRGKNRAADDGTDRTETQRIAPDPRRPRWQLCGFSPLSFDRPFKAALEQSDAMQQRRLPRTDTDQRDDFIRLMSRFTREQHLRSRISLHKTALTSRNSTIFPLLSESTHSEHLNGSVRGCLI